MEFRELGTTGVQVSALCLGTAFRGRRRAKRSEEECVATIERAVELGINFLDCANAYGEGWSEELLGRTVKRLGNRDELIITTKVGLTTKSSRGKDPLSRKSILGEIEQSLRRLQMDHVDVYLLHHPDPNTPLEETLRAMDDIVGQGKARFVGVSNHAATEIVEMLWIAERENLTSPAVLQFQYNLIHRWDTESDVVPLCHRHSLGLMGYSPLAIGLLTGQVRRGKPIPRESHWYENPDTERVLGRVEPIVATLIEVARQCGKTAEQIALAWILANPALSSAILGSDLPLHVESAVEAVDWILPPDAKSMLDEVSSDGGPFEMVGQSWREVRQRVPRRSRP